MSKKKTQTKQQRAEKRAKKQARAQRRDALSDRERKQLEREAPRLYEAARAAGMGSMTITDMDSLNAAVETELLSRGKVSILEQCPLCGEYRRHHIVLVADGYMVGHAYECPNCGRTTPLFTEFKTGMDYTEIFNLTCSIPDAA